MVRWISFSPPDVESYRLVPTASISSINTIDGACSPATRNSSRTSFGPSPLYFWINSDPTTRRNVADVWLATAFASRVLPAQSRSELGAIGHVTIEDPPLPHLASRPSMVNNSGMGRAAHKPTSPRCPVQNHTLGGLDPHFFVISGRQQCPTPQKPVPCRKQHASAQPWKIAQRRMQGLVAEFSSNHVLGVGEWQLNGLLDLLDLILQPTFLTPHPPGPRKINKSVRAWPTSTYIYQEYFYIDVQCLLTDVGV